jgi:heme-degrading monooxygenase HmoA
MTKPENAERYESLLKTEIFPGILARKISGFQRIDLLRREQDSEVEFITVMWFTAWEAVKEFAGDHMDHAVVPPKARAVLARFDERAQHYEVRESRAV